MEIKHTKHGHFWLYVTGMKMWTEPTLPYGIHLDPMLHEVKKGKKYTRPQHTNTEKGFGRDKWPHYIRYTEV